MDQNAKVGWAVFFVAQSKTPGQQPGPVHFLTNENTTNVQKNIKKQAQSSPAHRPTRLGHQN